MPNSIDAATARTMSGPRSVNKRRNGFRFDICLTGWRKNRNGTIITDAGPNGAKSRAINGPNGVSVKSLQRNGRACSRPFTPYPEINCEGESAFGMNCPRMKAMYLSSDVSRRAATSGLISSVAT